MNERAPIFVLCLTARTSIVWCDEQPVELSPGSDIKKVSAPTLSKVEETEPELKAKDGDTLETLPSNQNSQQYDYVVHKPAGASHLSLDLGQYDSGAQQPQQHTISSQYDSQQQSPPSAPIVYRYANSGDSEANADPGQQHSYSRQEPQHQIFEQKTFVRQAQVEQPLSHSQGSAYKIPELPVSQPGISSTYNSPEVKIVSHTRAFLPTVYKQSVEQSTSDGPGDQSSAEHEYDKAVQDRPGGSYGQQSDSYESDDRRPESHQQSSGGQDSYENSGAYRQDERQHRDQIRDSEVISRGPYYNIHKPHVAHVQVIEDKDEYRQEQKDGRIFGGQSYGLRNQPRQQFKNYKPSGYTPGMLSAYDPPSPPLSSVLASVGQGYRQTSQSDDDSYDDREQSGVGNLNIPEPQRLQQQQSQNQMPYGVEVEFDQNQKNEPNVLRGPGIGPQRSPQDYSDGADEQRGGNGGSEGQDYSREQERPDYSDNNNDNSYENTGNRGQDYENHNQLGPKYNDVGEDGPTAQGGYDRRPPQEMVKPQAIQYGFIPLSEAKDLLGGGYRGQEGYRSGRGRPNEGTGGFGPEGYREQNRGYGAPGGHRRPQQPYNAAPEGMGIMYGRGNQMENQRPGGFDGNDVYPGALNFGRKPAFIKNGGEDNYATEQEEVDGDEQDYGKHKHNNNTFPLDNDDQELGPNDPNRLPYECYPWNCNPWHSIHPNSPYNSVGAALKGRGPGPSHGSGLPPGASYNPRDVGLDEGVLAQLNLAASAPAGIAPGMVPIAPNGYRGGLGVHGGPGLDMNRPFPYNNVQAQGIPMQRPRPRPQQQPYSATGQGYRSQYGYRAAASELSPVSAAQTSPAGANSLSNLLNLNPVKSLRSLMSYLTGGING